jgi:hypothetical protein
MPRSWGSAETLTNERQRVAEEQTKAARNETMSLEEHVAEQREQANKPYYRR